MRKILLFTLLSVFIGDVYSQERQPFFYHLFADHGLTSDRTTTILQDNKGFIWIGTEEGLNKLNSYDQIVHYRFDRSDSSTLSNDHIVSLFEDSKKRLWVGTSDGLNLFRRKTADFQRVKFPHFESTDHGTSVVRDIKEGPEGNLWAICTDHVVEVDGTTLKEKGIYTLPDAELNLVRLVFHESRLRLGTSKGVYTLADGVFRKSEMARDLPITDLLAVGSDLWIGTVANGVLRHDAISGKTRRFTSDNEKGKLINNHVTDLTLIDDQKIWIGTIDGITSLDIKDYSSDHFYYDFKNAFSLSDRVIKEIYQDRAGVVWITTPNSGVNYYHKADNQFGYYGQTEENGTAADLMDYAVLSLHQQQDEIWLGSSKGISLLKNGKFEHYPFAGFLRGRTSAVMAIAKQNDNTLWLGTKNGLFKWDRRTRKPKFIVWSEFENTQINALSIQDGKLLVATEEKGLLQLDMITEEATPIDLGLSSHNTVLSATAIVPCGDGKRLVGTNQGLVLLSGEESTLVSLNSFMGGLTDELPINSLGHDTDGNVLVGTMSEGLLVLSEKLRPIYKVSKEDGLASEDIRSIGADLNGSIWVATNAGLSRLNRRQGRVFEVKNYDLQDGLQGNHFSNRAVARLSDGQMFFGGLSGLTFFNPDAIEDISFKQNLTLLSLAVKGSKTAPGEEGSPLSKALSMTDRISLNPDQNNFTLEFNALDYTRPLDVTYRYQLKGYDENWVEQKLDGTVTYQNLNGGKNYEFVVQSKGRFSDWSEPVSLMITVKPRFYETIWFQVLSIMVLGLLIAALIWYRTRRSAEKEKELEALIKERSAELHEQVSIRRETEKKLTTALNEAERASEVKSQFLANMSHEIRTPLNGIMGMAELSLQTELDSEQYMMLENIYKSADSLRYIVNDILDIAKIEAGQLSIEKEKYSIRKAMQQVMTSFQLQANEKNLSLKHWVLPKVPDLLFGDAGRLRQILVNLIANAMKFTHSGSITVIVDCMNQRATGLELWFTVSDTGIGIPEYQQENIFKSFVQVDNGASRAYGGTGLGLSISKELVEKMGGEIWVESEEGKGSIFSFYIRQEEYIQEESKVGGQEEQLSESRLTGTVLLVEDMPTNRLVASKLLGNMGVDVTCVNSGKEAVHLLKEKSFDLVLMDLQMPDLDGIETTRIIRASDHANRNVPIVALTAAAMPGSEERCLAAGMSGFLVKPISYQQLRAGVLPFLTSAEKSTI